MFHASSAPSAFLFICLTVWLASQPHRASAQESAPSSPSRDSAVLAPKLQKELGKALEELRAGASAKAQKRLEQCLKLPQTT